MSEPVSAVSKIDPAGRVVADAPPPFWSRWGRIYCVVAGLLAAQIVVFWLLSRWAA